MIITALLLGFAGSFHCVGMCSPLAMAVSNLTSTAILNRLVYNAGRILMYGMLGAAMATLGIVLPLGDFQNLVSILLGLVLILVALSGVGNFSVPVITRAMAGFSSKLKLLFSKFLQRRQRSSVFMLGALNGLLPCGLTFVALTFCLALEGPMSGFNFMLLFGAGTLPAMLGAPLLFQHLTKRFHWSFSRVTAVTLVVAGCLLIARVMLIHIPHVMSTKDDLVDVIMCK